MKPRALIALAFTLVFAAVGAWIWLGRESAVVPQPAAARGEDTGGVVKATPSTGVPTADKVKVAEPAPTPEPVRVASSVIPGMPLVRTTPTPQPPKLVAQDAAAKGPATSQPDPTVAGRAELEQVRTMLRDFRTRLGQNPVGSNAEIMKSIMGGNEARARLGPPPGQEVSEQGELLDRWGKPYFFHQLSKDSMEIRSAGPDGWMWTVDDLVTK